MPLNITMPALSPTMEEGTLARWMVKIGDEVEPGDVIAEIETDKATMEVEAVEEGRIGKILVEEGTENVKVNAPIAILLEEGEGEDDLKNHDTQDGKGDDVIIMPDTSGGDNDSGGDKSDTKQEPQSGSSSQDHKSTGNVSPSLPADSEPGTPSSHDEAQDQNKAKDQNQKKSGRIFASPLARRLAAQVGLSLENIKGSGPHGRIIKADIEGAKSESQASSRPEDARGAQRSSSTSKAAGSEPVSAGPDAKALADAYGMSYRSEKNSGMRKTIARRLLESKQSVPHYYLSIECQIDNLLSARKEMNDKADGAYKLSVNDFLIKACAMALKSYPAANVAWTDEEMLYFENADISVAVATPNGLITPIVKRAETKGLIDISNEVKDMAARARDGKLRPEEYQGGTFSISNLGMYGIDEFSAIINPPQSCIFAVGAGTQKPYAKDGEVKTGTFMKGVLSCDHRSVDGAVGAEFLTYLKRYIENPVSMLL